MAMNTGSKFHGVGTRPEAPAVVYTFGAAGSGAAAWKGFRAALGGRAEVRAIRLPGRESRQRERAVSSVREQLEDLAEDLAALVDADERPCVLVGLCSGALTAFEAARHLTVRSGHRPDALVVARQTAPSRTADTSAADEEFSAEEFQAWCAENFADRPELSAPSALEFFAPMLWADFSVTRGYRYAPLPLLTCPVTAVCEPEESAATRDWSGTTEGVFTLRRQSAPVTVDSLVAPTLDVLDHLDAPYL